MGKTLQRRSAAPAFLSPTGLTRIVFMILGCLGASITPRTTQANIGQHFGFGSRGASLAGASVARNAEGFAAYTNPAALAATREKRLILSWGLLSMTPNFTGINNIVVANDYTGDNAKTMGDVEHDYRSTFGQVVGLNYRILPDDSALSFGLTSFMPLAHAGAFDTGETYVPEYFLYRSRTQRPQFDMGLGYDPGAPGGLLVGVGAHIGFSLTASGSVFLQGTEERPSTMRFATSLKPKASPYLGMIYEGNAERKYTLGAVVRAPLTSPSHMELSTGARLFGDLAALDFAFSSYSALFYDPATIELGAAWNYSERDILYLQLEAQFWGLYEPPSLEVGDPTIEDCAGTNCGIDIAPSHERQLDLRHILVPRVAHETDFGKWILRAGYAFQPSVLARLPRGKGNYLDLSKHILTAGAGLRFKRFLSFETPVKVDFHLAFHQLVSQRVTKTEGNEAGDLTDEKIGAPGYTAGGREFGGGMSLTLAF